MADPKTQAVDTAKQNEDRRNAAKEALARANESRKQTEEDQERAAKGKPTPTQEENDLAKLGAPFDTHEDDGSGPEPKFVVTRQVEAAKQPSGSGYTTRTAQPQPQAPKSS